jgi:hypothetical protein
MVKAVLFVGRLDLRSVWVFGCLRAASETSVKTGVGAHHAAAQRELGIGSELTRPLNVGVRIVAESAARLAATMTAIRHI